MWKRSRHEKLSYQRKTGKSILYCQDYGHAILNAPNSPNRKKEPRSLTPRKKRNFVTKWIKEGISFANVVSGEVPNQTRIENKKEVPPVDSLAKIIAIPLI
ncbi:hypothetical protein TNCV_1235241 [Trichonephila clavipes]|nr:hypothetical protein TNCV_1235241 [Trichonephila clavipes]